MTVRPGERGFVTVAVLGITALVAGMIGALAASTAPTVALAHVDVERLRADALVQSGVNAAGYLLFVANAEIASINGMEIRFRSGRVRLQVSAEGGRVDLNAAGAELLEALAKAARTTSLSPQAFAARVADWRDADSDRLTGGAEAFDYQSAGRKAEPADAAFRSVEEARRLLGLSRGDFERLEPFLTTFNPAGTIDPEAAPPEVRAALRGIVSAPSIAAAGDGEEGREAPGAHAAFRVVVNAWTRSGQAAGAEVIMAAPSDVAESFSTLAWRDLPAARVSSHDGG